MTARPDEYEPGNQADELLQEWERQVAEQTYDEAIEDTLARAGVLAVLQVARELKRTRQALVELSRVIVDELGGVTRSDRP